MANMNTRLEEMPIETVVAAIEGNLFELFKSFSALPGAEIDEKDNSLSFVTGLDSPMFNGVSRARFMSDGDLGGKIEKTLVPFRERKVPMFWWTGPATQPLDLEEQLESYDMVPNAINMAGMAADLTSLSRVEAIPEGLVIEQVETAEALEEWGRAFTLSYNWPAPYAQAWLTASTSLGLGRDLPWRLYLGRLGEGGEAVGVSMMFLGEDAAGMYAVGTVPQARRRGIGSAMVVSPLMEAHELGYSIGVLHSNEQAESIYRHLGFKEYCRLNPYTLR